MNGNKRNLSAWRRIPTFFALLTAFCVSSGAVDYPTNGLMFYWNLDEGTGLVANDLSGNGRHGTLNGFPGDDSQWITGYTNAGVHFNPGVTGNVASAMAIVSPNIAGTTSTTWAVWCRMNLNDTNSFANLIGASTGAGAGHNLGFDTTGRFPRLLWNNGATPSTTIASTEAITSEWTHLAVTWDAATSNLTLYVNGSPKANSTTAGGRSFNTVNIGRRGNERFPWRDDVDEIFVYNRALTPEEVASLAGISGGPPQIVTPPKSQVVWRGETAVFTIAASGTPNPTYQWYWDGETIQAETDPTLSIPNAQATNAGAYTVVVSNSSGTITSLPAMLAIRPLTNIPPSVPSWIPQSGLVFYWNMDETTNYAAWDYSGNQHHGSLVGLPFDGSRQVEGFILNGVSLFPADAGVHGTIQDLPSITNTTWAAWVRLLQPLGAATVLSATFPGAVNGHNFGFDNTSTTQRHPRVLWNSGIGQSIITSPEPIDDEWNHLAMTYDEATQALKLFVNGVEKAMQQPAGSTAFTSLVMGRRATTGMQPFGGLIDEVTVYDRALSNEEIYSMFTNSLAQGVLPFRYLQLQIESIEITDQTDLAIVMRTLWPGEPHKLEARDNLSSGPWQELENVTFEVLTNNRVRAALSIPASPSLVIRASVMPPAPLFFDDFEGGASGWTHGGDNDNWELGAPTSGPGSAHSGANVYATGLAGNYNTPTDCFLRSPAIDLTAVVSGAKLTFWEYRDIFPNLSFHRGIINIVDADTLEVIGEVFRVAGTSDGWAERVLAMPAGAHGKQVRIEFRVQTDPFDPRPGWYIDDVSVQK
jgi:hypothetical protein